MLSRSEMDQQLSQVLNEYLDHSLADLPTEEELAATMPISPRFEVRMQPLLDKARKMETRQQKLEQWAVVAPDKAQPFSRLRFLNRKRLIAAMLVIAILTSVVSISIAREKLFDFFIRIYERYSELSFREPDTSISKSRETDPETESSLGLLPEKTPSGFSETERMEAVGFVQIVYANEAGSEVIFNRQLASGLQMSIDTEGIQTESINIHGSNGLYYSNKGVQNVIWKEGPFAYSISGAIDKGVLIDMAQATK